MMTKYCPIAPSSPVFCHAVFGIDLIRIRTRAPPHTLSLQLGKFGWVKLYVFPCWFAALAACFLFFETRKQYRRFFKKGVANVCGCVDLVNERHGDDGKDRLMPRNGELPIYTVEEFNDKVNLVPGAFQDCMEAGFFV